MVSIPARMSEKYQVVIPKPVREVLGLAGRDQVMFVTGLLTPEAIQVAAAQQVGADAIITKDHRWRGGVVHDTDDRLCHAAGAGVRRSHRLFHGSPRL